MPPRGAGGRSGSRARPLWAVSQVNCTRTLWFRTLKAESRAQNLLLGSRPLRLTVTSHAATTLMARLLGFRLPTGLSLFAVILLWLNLISIVHVTSSIAYRATEQVSEHSLVPPAERNKELRRGGAQSELANRGR